MWNIHGEPTVSPINLVPATIGDNTIVAAPTIGETFIQGFMIIADAATTVTLKFGTRTLGVFKLAAAQTVNLSDIPGMEGEPVLKGFVGEAFILNSSAAVTITGMVKYARKDF